MKGTIYENMLPRGTQVEKRLGTTAPYQESKRAGGPQYQSGRFG